MLLSKATYSAFRLYMFYHYVCSLGIEPTTFCAANAMLYHWATGTQWYSLTVLLVAVSCKLQLDDWPVGSGDRSWATLSPAVSESLVWFCSESPALSGPVRSAEEFCPSRHCNEPPLRFSQTPPYRLSLKLQPESTITHTHTVSATFNILMFLNIWERWLMWSLSSHLNMLQPVGGLEIGKPVRFLNVGIDNLLQFP